MKMYKIWYVDSTDIWPEYTDPELTMNSENLKDKGGFQRLSSIYGFLFEIIVGKAKVNTE